MLTPRATSDDERDPAGTKTEDGRDVYFIKRRPERSAKAEQLIRRLDQLRENDAAWGGGRVAERARLIPANGQQDSTFKRLAKDLPIDYFDPAFFNQLPAKRRAIVSNTRVVLPDNLDDLFDDDLSDNEMDSREFAEQYPEYVEDVLSRYKLIAFEGDDLGGFIASDEAEEDDDEDEDEDDDGLGDGMEEDGNDDGNGGHDTESGGRRRKRRRVLGDSDDSDDL